MSAPFRQLDDPRRAFHANPGHLLRSENFHSEAPGLGHGAPRQVAAAQSGRKAEVVLNARAHSRLAARRFHFDQHRAAAPPTHRKQPPPSPPVRRRRSPDRKTPLRAACAAQAFPPIARCLGQPKMCHRERAPWASRRLPPRPPPPGGAPRRLAPPSPHRSIDKAPGCGQENRGSRKNAETSACPERGPLRTEAGTNPPILQQVIEHGVEVLLRRVPGLQQVVMDSGVVDGAESPRRCRHTRSAARAWRWGRAPSPVRGTPPRSSAACADRPEAAPPNRPAA